MKTGGGDFTPEAYEQLREAYAGEQNEASRIELAGKEVMGQRLGLETLPVESPWADKVENWKYPDGKSEYLDEKQSPDEILEIMRQSAMEKVEAKKEEEDPDGIEEMSDEEFDAHIDKVLAETEEVEEEETDEEEESDEEDTDETEEESEEEDAEEEESEEEPVAEAAEEPEEEEYDAEAIAAQISELRAELEGLNFVPDQPVEEEEPASDDESE